jgi:hypothetical protein
MADMYGAIRSSEFQVKDAEAFQKFFEENCYFGGETNLWIVDEDTRTFAFGGYEQYPSAYPRLPFSEESPAEHVGEWGLAAFAKAFHEHLAEGHNLVVVAAGNEELRYVAAQRLTVHSDGTGTFDEFYAGN